MSFSKRIGVILLCSVLIKPSAQAAEVQVGIGQADATPPIGVPLAGHGDRRKLDLWGKYSYATWMKPSEGILDPIRVKAMVIQKEHRHLVFISIDLVAIDSRILRDVLKRIGPKHGIQREDLILSATHTHNGPGTLSRNTFWNLVTMDRFQEKILDGILNKVEEAVDLAFSQLQPSKLFTVSFDAFDIQRNRRKQEGNFDPQANLLVAQAQNGAWLGGLVNFAVHGTSLKVDNLHFSADLPGYIERALEARVKKVNLSQDPDPTFLFINGAEGDVIPVRGGYEEMLNLSESFANQALTAMSNLQSVEPQWKTHLSQIDLGAPKLNLAGCFSPKQKPTVWSKLIWKFRLYLGWSLPTKTRLHLTQLGHLTFMSWPGEPTTNLGRALKEMAKKLGHRSPWVLGLTNDHLAYFTDPEEYRDGGYESCASFYGEDSGIKIIDHYQNLLTQF